MVKLIQMELKQLSKIISLVFVANIVLVASSDPKKTSKDFLENGTLDGVSMDNITKFKQGSGSESSFKEPEPIMKKKKADESSPKPKKLVDLSSPKEEEKEKKDSKSKDNKDSKKSKPHESDESLSTGPCPCKMGMGSIMSYFEDLDNNLFNSFINGKGYDGKGYDMKGYDVKGYDGKGYDVKGCDGKGYDMKGYDGKGYDMKGYDKNESKLSSTPIYETIIYDNIGKSSKSFDEKPKREREEENPAPKKLKSKAKGKPYHHEIPGQDQDQIQEYNSRNSIGECDCSNQENPLSSPIVEKTFRLYQKVDPLSPKCVKKLIDSEELSVLNRDPDVPLKYSLDGHVQRNKSGKKQKNDQKKSTLSKKERQILKRAREYMHDRVDEAPIYVGCIPTLNISEKKHTKRHHRS